MAKYRKLGRSSSHRQMLLRNMTTSLLAEERIETTEAKAKELRKSVAKMITLAKKNDLSSRRKIESYLNDKDVCKKLLEEIAPKYEERNGGYTRIIKKGPRRGDAAFMVLIELV